jgi:hypothetical protein
MSDLVCPVCMNGDHLWDIDRIDYDVWVIRCANCGWVGTSEELFDKEIPSP